MGRKSLSLSANGKTINADGLADLIAGNGRSYRITEAQLKDDYCHYGYEITSGVGLGDNHKVQGSGIVKDSLRDAFAQMSVHLACVDDVFKHSGYEISDIDREHGHELTMLYHLTGFKITGTGENESIILMGTKYVSSAGGRIDLKSPKIPLDSLSSYKWYNELKAAADHAREEVALYKEGNYEQPDADDDSENKGAKQLTIGDGIDAELESAKV